jgi:hypothetical protein
LIHLSQFYFISAILFQISAEAGSGHSPASKVASVSNLFQPASQLFPNVAAPAFPCQADFLK